MGLLIAFTLESSAGKFLPARLVAMFRWPQRANVVVVRWMAYYIVGLHSQKENRDTDVSDEWSGRINYIRSIVKEIVHESQEEISSEIVALETVRTNMSESLLRLLFRVSHSRQLERQRLYEHDLVKQESLNKGRSATSDSSV